jgi:alkylation response protein AidB-like acyl-CoA dehydrogenase
MDGVHKIGGFETPPGARAAKIAPLIDQLANDIDDQRRLPAELLTALHENGLFRMLLPKSFGGEEVTPLEFMDAIETLARHDASVAWCIGQANGCAMTAAYLAPEISEEIWGRDPLGVVAWGPGQAEAKVVEGGYRLSASLMFASGGRHATWLGCHTAVKGGDGVVIKGPEGNPELRTFLMPAPEIDMVDVWDVIGLRGTASDAYNLKEVFVPEQYVTARDKPYARVYDAPLYIYPSMTMFAQGFACVALGIAQGALGDFLAFAQGKTPRLAKSTVSDSAVAQTEIAHASARIMAARALLRQEAEAVWDEVCSTGELTVAARARIRLASTYAIHEAKSAVDVLFDLAGADAIFKSKPFERRFRDIHTVTQQLQGRKTHLQSVGAWMMGKDPDLSIM